MKKLFVLSILFPLAMVCSCQKQDVAAEQQLAQRKVDLDAREKALDQRENALTARERAIARAVTLPKLQTRPLNTDTSSNVQPSSTMPPGLAPPNNTDIRAGRERRMEEVRALRQRRLEAIQRMRSLGARPSTSIAPANTGASPGSNESTDTSGSTSGDEETSPSPSPTP